MKSDTAAFQDLTAEKVSRFVTLSALTRLPCRSERLRWNMTGNTPPASDRAARLETSGSGKRSQVKGCMTAESLLLPRLHI